MIWQLLSLFGIKQAAGKMAEQQRQYESQLQREEAELLELDTPEMDEVYEQGYEDALEGRDFEDTSEEYAAGYQDALDDIERSEETW